MARATTEAERLCRDYLDTVWNEREYARIPELVTSSFAMYDPAAIDKKIPGPSGEVHGPDGLETFVRSVVAGFPDFHVAVDDVLADDELVMYAGTLSMTHEGTFYWIPPTGRSAEVQYMGRLRVEDGKVSEHRVYPPLQAIVAQLGFTSTAVIPYLPKLAWAALRHGAPTLR